MLSAACLPARPIAKAPEPVRMFAFRGPDWSGAALAHSPMQDAGEAASRSSGYKHAYFQCPYGSRATHHKDLSAEGPRLHSPGHWAKSAIASMGMQPL